MWYFTLFLIFGTSWAFELSKNILFRPLHEISTSRSKWLITLVHDLGPFDDFVGDISMDIGKIFLEIEDAVAKYDNDNATLDNHFTLSKLQLQIVSLRDMHVDFLEELGDLRSLTSKLKVKSKRSLLPFIGDLSHALFGLVTESELDGIRNGIKDLAVNQKTISHVIEKSLSILNISRRDISANRQTINHLNKSLAKLDQRILVIFNEVKKQFLQLKMFIHTYIRLSQVIDDLKLLMLKAELFLQTLHLQLNMLSQGRLSPSTITPLSLRNLLRDIQEHLPPSVRLSQNPDKDLWLFYQFLTCATVIENNMIITTITVPLVDTTDGDYQLFKAHNLPLPLNSDLKRPNLPALPNIVAKYNLESNVLAINRQRTKYILLSDSEANTCSTPLMSYCKVASPVYPINLSKFCIVALFMENERAIAKFCQVTVIPNAILPLAEYISNGFWILTTIESFKLSILCHDVQPAHSYITVNPPVSVVALKATCSATSNYLNLTPYYKNESKIFDQYSFDKISSLFNKSISQIWKPITNTFKNLSALRLPSPLKNIKEISMDHLVDELHRIREVEISNSNFPEWGYAIVSLAIIVLALIIFGVVFKKYKLKCPRPRKKLGTQKSDGADEIRKTEYIELQPNKESTSTNIYPELPKVFNLSNSPTR